MATYTSELRQFNKTPFKINKVYSPYRKGWNDSEKKFHTFKLFPKCDEKVIISGQFPEELKGLEANEWREEIYNKDQKRFEYHKVTQKIGKEFYSLYKKVFDISVTFEKPINVCKYKDVFEEATEVVFSAVSSGKVKNMIRTLVDDEIPQQDGVDRLTGEVIKVDEYDFEDTMKDKLEGKFVSMKITGAGLETKYLFIPSKEFAIKEATKGEDDVFKDLPF